MEPQIKKTHGQGTSGLNSEPVLTYVNFVKQINTIL